MSSLHLRSTLPAELSEAVDIVRLDAARRLDPLRRGSLGQFFTAPPVARLMASLSTIRRERVRLLDAGAGVGVLSAAWIAHACEQDWRPRSIEVVAYELDHSLIPDLRHVLDRAAQFAEARGVAVEYELRTGDFITAAVHSLDDGLFSGSSWPEFDAAILNPPYKKFRTDSDERRLLRDVGLETSNLYTAFVALALRGLTPGGELIAITPRSFCNGPYFTPFRKDLLRLANLTHLHIFDSRGTAFGDDEVLQENVIFRVERAAPQVPNVVIEWSDAGESEHVTRRDVPFRQVVQPADPDSFIHITPDESGTQIAEIVERLAATLSTLAVQVSTGRVVDFRAKDFLRSAPSDGTVPLIYPMHLSAGGVRWPKLDAKKPNALLHVAEVEGQLNPSGVYVLVKRFSSKEERRRVVAAVITPDDMPGKFIAFENHLNYFHRQGSGLPAGLARGLAAYLNSTLVDSYFRQFNGHTQVNATDLRKLRYPTAEQLDRIGAQLTSDAYPEQDELDKIVEGEIVSLSNSGDETRAFQQHITDASAILSALGLPREQTNERAALTLLALANLKPDEPWAKARNPLRGVTPIMAFVAEHYGKQWAPNTRETVRRFTLHQFQDAGLVVPNPDKPTRPVNSPAYCYQVSEGALALLRAYGTDAWSPMLKEYLASAPSLAARYASEREMTRIPLGLRGPNGITLSPGGQNELIAHIVNEFCERFTPGAVPVYIGDADAKWAVFDEAVLGSLGVTVDAHGKMPDVVVYMPDKNWLVIVEAVTSHGPVNAKRRSELKTLFASSSAPLVYVTAFMSRQAMVKYLNDIAWETEVWVADAPSHLIHFNGERFLGPYD